MKILKIFGVVVAVHAAVFMFVFAIPGCRTTSRPAPATPATDTGSSAPTVSYPGSGPVASGDASASQGSTENMAAGSGETPTVAFTPASSQHFNPTRPGTPVAQALQTNEVTGVTPATTYKVVSNDSLWKVAKKHGIGIDDLAKANNLRPNSPLKVGQKLIIPGKTPSASASGAASGTRTYIVKSGDSVGTIARKQGATIADIRSLNPQIKNDVVRAGQELTLPASAASAAHAATATPSAPVVASAPVTAPAGSIEHIVKPGEGLGQIAKKYGVPQREIAVLNNIADPASIRAGQKLVIPGVKTPSSAAPAITLPAEQAPVSPVAQVTPSENPVAPTTSTEASPVAPSDAPAPPVVKVEESAPVSSAK